MSVGLLRVDRPMRQKGLAPAGKYTLGRQAVLLLLCLLWFFPGVIGRAPWKPTETTMIPAIAESMAAGEWFRPQLFGKPYVESPPLPNAVAAAAAHVFSPPLKQHEAMRLGNVLWLGLGLLLIGCAVGWHNGSRAGWRAVLLVTASPSLLLHARTVNPDLILLGVGAAGLVGVHLLRIRPLLGSLVLGLTATVGVMSNGLIAVWYVAALVLLPLIVRLRSFRWRHQAASGAALLLAALGVSWCLFVFWGRQPELLAQLGERQLAALQPLLLFVSLQELLVGSVWILWPALPFAAVAALSVRNRASYPTEVGLGLLACGAGALAIVCAGDFRESKLFLLLPLVSIIASVSVTRMTKEIAKVMDWCAVIVIGGGLIGFLWVVWLLALTGVSPALLEWLSGNGVEQPTFSWSVGLAVLASLLWVGLMLRIGRSPERSVLNWMAGGTMGWCVFTLLWLPAVDRAKGYELLAADLEAYLSANLREEECVRAEGLPGTVMAQLQYYTGREFATSPSTCEWRLASFGAHPQGAVWIGGRSGDKKDELLVLLPDG